MLPARLNDRPGRRSWTALALVAGLALAVDQVAKHLVVSRLGLGEAVHVVGPLEVTHTRNPGMAFGLFPDGRIALIAIGLAMLLALLVAFARLGGRSRLLPLAAGLVLGGSASNLTDRVRLHSVVDFLDPGYGGTSNIADQCIVAGAVVLALVLAFAGRRDERGTPQPAAQQPPGWTAAPAASGELGER